MMAQVDKAVGMEKMKITVKLHCAIWMFDKVMTKELF